MTLKQAAMPSDRHTGAAIVAPALLFLLAMNVFPLLYAAVMSFTDAPISAGSAPTQWIGFANYARVFTPREGFLGALGTTALFTVIAVSIELVLGFALALAMRERLRLPGRGLVLIGLLIPMMLSPVVMGTFWRLILDPSCGILNQTLALVTGAPLAAQPGWLREPGLQAMAIIAIDVWMWTPFMMLVALAGLNSIPKHLYEAAAIDRARPWTVFRRITLPLCLPLLLLAVLLRTTDAIKQFDLVMAIAGPDRAETRTLSVKLYQVLFTSEGNLGLGMAYAIVVLIPVMILATLLTRVMGRIQAGAR